MSTDHIEATYNEFWRDLVETDGKLDPAKVKAELHDYRNFMNEVTHAYCTITGGRISKPNTLASEVITTVQDLMTRDRDEAIEELRAERDRALTLAEGVVRDFAEMRARLLAKAATS